MASWYTVKKGDTLEKIAKKFGTTVKKLRKLNPKKYKNTTKVHVGQRVKLSGGSSGGGSTAKAPSAPSAAPNQASVSGPYLQADTDRTVYATWSWGKGNVDHYEIRWYYDDGGGRGIWFEGSVSTTTSCQSVYNAPENSVGVLFKVLPVSTTYTVTTKTGKKKKKKTTTKTLNHWVADWSPNNTYYFSQNPPKVPPTPNVTIEDFTLTASVDNLDVDAKQIQFQIVRDDTSIFNTGNANIVTNHASYSCTVASGSKYKVRCRSVKDDKVSEWSDYSGSQLTKPNAPSGITSCRATSPTSVYIEWGETPNATSYDLEYTTNIDYFNGSDGTSTVTGIDTTHYEKTGLESGDEYFFRIRAVNDAGASPWTQARSVIIGKPPAAPTTWSSTTTAIIGESLTLYWVHNSEDGSSQTVANLELIVNGSTQSLTITNTTDESEKDKISYYIVDTSQYSEGVKIQWRVRTAGITGTYGDWSIQRVIDIYEPPSLELTMKDVTGSVTQIIGEFPFHVSGIARPKSQRPIGYNLTIIANSTYETVDDLGNVMMVNEGSSIYSKHFDISDTLEVDISASDVNLDNGISYTLKGIVSMNSGLTAEATVQFNVAWTDQVYSPNAEITIDTETLCAHIRPYCEKFNVITSKVENDHGIYTISSESMGEADDITTTSGEIVEVGLLDDGTEIFYCSVSESSLVDGEEIDVEYKVERADDGIFTKTSEKVDTDDIFVGNDQLVYYGRLEDGTETYYTRLEEGALAENVLMSIYRREFDGSFTEISKDLNNLTDTYVTDPHPALDYARYRIVARDIATGAISYYDMPAYPIGEKSIIIQWDDKWTEYLFSGPNEAEEPAWSGSMLSLPYNIDVADKGNVDVALIEYIGREHPVTYYGTQVGQTATWNVAIDKNDVDTLYALRRLSRWMGDVYVREPSGSGYWANISVSFSQKHTDLIIPVTLEIVRVEGGV